MNRNFPKALFFSVLLLSGCAQFSDKNGLYQEQASAWTIEQNNNRLQTIGGLIQSGKGSAAKQQADSIAVPDLTPDQLTQFSLLNAQIQLSFGEAEQALKTLTTIDPEQLAINDKIQYFQSKSFAYSLIGNLFESAKARIVLDPLLTNINQRQKNQAIILESLGFFREYAPANQQVQLPELPAWMEIAKILSTRNQNPAAYKSALANWQAVNPQHPANIYLSSITSLPEAEVNMPSSIAILLPESGPYTDAGKAVKAGFLAAHSHDNSGGNKPELHFYNTEKKKMAELYQQAIDEGAKLVIGPLNKENIQSLVSSANLSIPVLALNNIPELSKQNLYQFALSPMDDVAEVTHKAAVDGHKKALLLVPDNEQSKRVSSYFMNNWQAQNGTVVEKQTYNPKLADFSSTIKKLLNLDESENRYQKILSFFPFAKAEPRPRQDVDALFLNAYSTEGRLINTQLQNLKATNLAVYALPSIYSGTTNSMKDTALNTVTFCDIPWLFNAAYGGDLSMVAQSNVWRQFPENYIRLVAMGIDAYHLAGRLPTLKTGHYSGATGILKLASDNRITRNLVCAKFAKGQPELIGFTHSPNEGITGSGLTN